MEVFNVFATMSLMDMISGPLGSIATRMDMLKQRAVGLGDRMGKLAVAMAPVALAAAVLLATLGLAAREAIAFESSMADVAKVVNFESAGELQSMSDTILDMSMELELLSGDADATVLAARAWVEALFKGDQPEVPAFGIGYDVVRDRMAAGIVSIAGVKRINWASPVGDVDIPADGLATLTSLTVTARWVTEA